jgi:Putative antitoxin
MPSINITISTEAHARLASLKKSGQSFSDVILEHVYPPPCKNAGELIDSLREEPPPYPAIERLDEIRAERGKRSNRPSK